MFGLKGFLQNFNIIGKVSAMPYSSRLIELVGFENYSNHITMLLDLLDININGRYANALQVLVIEILFVLITLIIIEISVSFTRVFESIMLAFNRRCNQSSGRKKYKIFKIVINQMGG